ncbi:MAG: hypothetical protein ACLUOI_25670 [Eisenbergiella sp.]
MKDEDYNIPEDQDYTSAVSAYDCRSDPAGTVHEKTLEAYREFIPSAPEMSEKEMEQMRERIKRKPGLTVS